MLQAATQIYCNKTIHNICELHINCLCKELIQWRKCDFFISLDIYRWCVLQIHRHTSLCTNTSNRLYTLATTNAVNKLIEVAQYMRCRCFVRTSYDTVFSPLQWYSPAENAITGCTVSWHFWQLPVWPVMKISSKLWYSRFSVVGWWHWRCSYKAVSTR